MKSFKASIYIQGKTGSIDTIVQANNETDARKLIQAQYGKALIRIASTREVR